MSIFRWTAPLLQFAARRLTDDDLRPWADRLRPFVGPGGVFADLGGGTGDIGAGIARALDARVVIVDPVPEMLRRVPAHPLVSVRLASVDALPFPDGYFDAAFCCDAFHHFRDQDAAAREMARVVRPGGGVLILDAERTGPNRGIALFERMLGEPAGFHRAGGLQEFMTARGVVGSSTLMENGRGYFFAGTIAPTGG
ncbi:MAG: class I SAM-dependent methyltransferase [Thermoleophilia bacterium]|nr:class I SAM-dependent methyltransferase [Thermoleophilia bacterium]